MTAIVFILALAPWASWKHTALILCVVSLGNVSRQTYGLLIIAYLHHPAVVDYGNGSYTCLGSLGSMKTYRIISLFCLIGQGVKPEPKPSVAILNVASVNES